MVKRYHTARIILVCLVFGCLTIGISPRVMSLGNGLDGDFVAAAMAEGDGDDHDGDDHDGDDHDGDDHDGDDHDGGGEAGGPAPSYKVKPTVKQY